MHKSLLNKRYTCTVADLSSPDPVSAWVEGSLSQQHRVLGGGGGGGVSDLLRKGEGLTSSAAAFSWSLE